MPRGLGPTWDVEKKTVILHEQKHKTDAALNPDWLPIEFFHNETTPNCFNERFRYDDPAGNEVKVGPQKALSRLCRTPSRRQCNNREWADYMDEIFDLLIKTKRGHPATM